MSPDVRDQIRVLAYPRQIDGASYGSTSLARVLCFQFFRTQGTQNTCSNLGLPGGHHWGSLKGARLQPLSFFLITMWLSLSPEPMTLGCPISTVVRQQGALQGGCLHCTRTLLFSSLGRSSSPQIPVFPLPPTRHCRHVGTMKWNEMKQV